MPEQEIRCPYGANRLFMKLISEGERPQVTSGNLLELACSDCARMRRKSGEDIFRVLHRYFINGLLAETVIQYDSGVDEVITH